MESLQQRAASIIAMHISIKYHTDQRLTETGGAGRAIKCPEKHVLRRLIGEMCENARYCTIFARKRRVRAGSSCVCAAGRRECPPTRAICGEKRGKERKNAELRGFRPEKARLRRPPCVYAAGRRECPPMRIICGEKRGKERKNAEMRDFAQKCRVRAVCPAAVRRDGGCARQCALFALKNAEKSEKTRLCSVLLSFARKFEFLQHITVARPEQ